MGSRREAAQESHIAQQTLDDPDLCTALQVFNQLLCASAGPHGRIQSVQNSVGGPITMTTSANRLLSAMSFSRPCLHLVVSAIQGHLRNHHDGGLLAGSLCLHLIQSAVGMEDVSKKCVREVYELLLNLVDVYLNSDDCPISVNVDTSNVKVMLAYVRSVIAAKPVCGLRPASASHLSQLALKAFLNSVPNTPKSFLSDRVFALQFDKTDVMSSEILEGLLLEWPERSTLLGAQELHVIRVLSQEVRVALVSVSMSGDAEELMTNKAEAKEQVIQSAADLMMRRMLAFCDWLHEHQVGLLLCQKVIHPKVKFHLRRKGILFVERLGLQPMGYIQDLTGASPISSVLVLPAESACGQLSSVRHLLIHKKSYLHLQMTDSCVCTMLLCGAIDEQLAELKGVMKASLTGLYSVLERPQVLCGGGCWQTHLANYVRHEVMEREDQLCSQLHITKAQLLTSASAFASSLDASAHSLLSPSFHPWVDASHWHMWHAPQGVDVTMEATPFSCACGMFTDFDIDTNRVQSLLGTERKWLWNGICERRGEDIPKGRLTVRDSVNPDWLVLDTMECVVSAVRTAVMTATTVLSITQYIHDVN